jgi:hypothetical protein
MINRRLMKTKHGEHIFNLGLGKSFNSLAVVINSQSFLTASFTKAVNIVNTPEFYITVKR